MEIKVDRCRKTGWKIVLAFLVMILSGLTGLAGRQDAAAADLAGQTVQKRLNTKVTSASDTTPDPGSIVVTVPATVEVAKAAPDTPDPGDAVFHFNIWSDTGVSINIIANAVSTHGVGSFSGELSFSVPADQYEKLKSDGFKICQFDGNADWVFDQYVFDMFYDTGRECFARWPKPEDGAFFYFSLDYIHVKNTCQKGPSAPTAPAVSPGEGVIISVPATVEVLQGAGEPLGPGDAVFHFGITSAPGIEISIINNTVYTSGTGIFTGVLSFSVPVSQYAALKEESFYISQFDGNPDWYFEPYIFNFFYDAGKDCFMRWPKPTSGTYFALNDVYVTNIYQPGIAAATVPEPTQPQPPAGLPEEILITETEEETTFILPVTVNVEKDGEEPVPAAVLHFGLDCIEKAQKYTLLNDVIYTSGEGEYSGKISFSVPAGEETQRIIATGFDVYQRAAVVEGWSFAGEVYHVSLSREDGALKAKITRHRNVATAEIGKEILYFLTRYGMTDGVQAECPATMIAVLDLIREAWSLENGCYQGDICFETEGGSWKIAWSGISEGNTFSGTKATVNYSPAAGGETKEETLEDFLRINEDGVFIRMKAAADVYEKLSGKQSFMAEDIPEEDWTVFTQDDISWLDLSALDELFRRMLRDGGCVLDELPVYKVSGGYRISANELDWSSFEYLILDEAQLNHEIWKNLADKAAVSEEMKKLAEDFEEAFCAFNEKEMSDVGLKALIKEKYPAYVEKLEGVLNRTEDGCYAFSIAAEVADSPLKEVSIALNAAPAEETEGGPEGSPEAAASGSDFLKKLLAGLSGILPDEAQEPGEDETQTQGPDGGGSDPSGYSWEEIEEWYWDGHCEDVYECADYRFVVPEFWRGKVDGVLLGSGDLTLSWHGYPVVRIVIAGPEAENEIIGEKEDPIAGGYVLWGGAQAEGRNVYINYNCYCSYLNHKVLAQYYPFMSDEELERLMYLQTGKRRTSEEVLDMAVSEADGEAFSFTVGLVQENMTTK